MTTKSAAVATIQELIDQLANQLSGQDVDERAWMAERCPPELADSMAKLTLTALHLLDAIAAAEPVNVVGLAQATGTPKGTISKLLSRLTEDGLVVRERRPDNRKEVYVRLSENGRVVQNAHGEMHREMEQGITEFFNRYTADELDTAIRMLTDLSRTPRVGVRLRPDLMPR